MTASINEWEFTSNVKGWIDLALAKTTRLPFAEARCERSTSGSRKRNDLTLFDRNGIAVLTGEVKLPFAHDGGSPYNHEVVEGARAKAARAKVRFFFTWNVNQFVLWETYPTGTPRQDRNYKSWDVTKVIKPDHLLLPAIEYGIQKWLAEFLTEYAQLLAGATILGRKAPDEKFIDALEAALSGPIQKTTEELEARYANDRCKSELDKWMLDQGWTILDDVEGIRDNLDRTAKFTCYSVVNKLVFHEALLRRYGGLMDRLDVPSYIESGEALRLHLEGFFARAKQATGDYETVFGLEATAFENGVPFYSDKSVPYWRNLIEQIHEFDFSRIDHEVIGNIFERFNSPEERHKYGQFYTRVEVVDLINSFCIREADAKIMDPACGGGTFLVRAYHRKKNLDPARAHTDLLTDLFGVDVSRNAAHLTTINLATRDLIDEENYPQIARSDFFTVLSNKAFMALPSLDRGRIKAGGLGPGQSREVKIPLLDAVVGNPPYIRQERIPKSKKTKNGPEPGTKERYQQLIREEARLKLSGRSDLHCYFWPHAASFLKPDGWFGFLTSSQWLDVEYGFKLQGWILDNFEIVAILESLAEPWFVGARVATTVTILRRQPDQEARMANRVRFVQLRRPLAEIMGHDGTKAGAQRAADAFRDEILSLTANTANQRYRARVVPQHELWRDGVALGALMTGSPNEAEDSEDEAAQAKDWQADQYYGGKWGVHLRAPDLWFDLMDRYGERFTPLGQIADIWRGITSGKDEFFFPRDTSAKCLADHPEPMDFQVTYGVPRREVDSGRVKLVLCGEKRGELRPIEAKYLEPEVHSLMEVKGFTVGPQECARTILLVGLKKDELRDQYVKEYIEWGEKKLP